MKDVTEEIISYIEIKDANSSTIVFVDLFVRCTEVKITRQKPKRPTEVFNICCEVLFAISI